MKKEISKIIFTIMAILMILLLGKITVKATEVEKIIYEDKDGNYLIYYKEYMNSAFRFVITENETEPDITSSKSSIEDGGKEKLNVAYVYENAPLKDQKGYIWIIGDDDTFKVKADPIDLSAAIDDEKIKSVNEERIAVDANQKYESTRTENGVTKNVTLGKIVLKDKDGKYEYQLIKVEKDSSEEKLFELSEKLGVEVEGTYAKLELNKAFYDLYNELKPEKGWTAVENNEILQPESAEKGDKYIVWLRNAKDNKVDDVKLFISDYEYTPEYKKEDKVIVETVSTPITYDNPALFIVVGVILVAIVVIAILRKKSKKEDK